MITFIDDYSRFCYVYLSHAKDEALEKFEIIKSEVGLKQKVHVKRLRMDNGGEYYYPDYSQLNGISHETTGICTTI